MLQNFAIKNFRCFAGLKLDSLARVNLIAGKNNTGKTAVLEALLQTEAGLGRLRSTANAPRTVDLDLIAHGRRVIDEPGLVLPHPRAADRLFVMGPLAEIAPDWRHPVFGKTAAELAAAATVGQDAHPI